VGQVFGVRDALNVAGYPLGKMLGGMLLEKCVAHELEQTGHAVVVDNLAHPRWPSHGQVVALLKGILYERRAVAE
jgi:hypothetical protein